MNLFFDEESQKLIISAKNEMFKLKHPYVGSEHLLLAILNNTNLNITDKLNNYGITYDKFKNKLISTVGIGTKTNNWFLFTPLLKKIINNATYYSKDNNKVVTPFSLLVSILKEGDGVANRILLSMNIDVLELYSLFVNSDDLLSSKKVYLLDELGINMNLNSLNNKYDPVIGREKELNEIICILLRKNKNNPLLVGDAGVGKTAIVEELARRISLGNVPFKLKDKIIYSVSMSMLVSGTKYRGEFEEKIHKLIKEVEENSNIILFIDEIHTLVGAGGAEGAIDASNILKPYLARGSIKIIGATTSYEYKKFIKFDKALNRRFQKVDIIEPSKDLVKNILLELKPLYEDYHKVIITKQIIDIIIDISYDSIFYGKQPDKAIDLLDNICSYVVINNNKNDKILSDMEFKIKQLENKKNNEIINHNFKKALRCKNEENIMKSDYNNKLFDFNRNSKIRIHKNDIYNVIYNKIGFSSKKEYLYKLNCLSKDLKKSISGQDNVIDEIVYNMKNCDYINKNALTTFLFIGKKSVGKTFLVRKIVKDVFSNINYISLDMFNYNDDQSLSKIIGVSPGYVGYNDEALFDSIKDNPFTVILLDNVNQGNKKVLSVLFEAFRNGFIVNKKGDKINLAKSIVFMTYDYSDDNLGFIEEKQNNLDTTYDFVTYIIKFNDVLSLC